MLVFYIDVDEGAKGREAGTSHEEFDINVNILIQRPFYFLFPA